MSTIIYSISFRATNLAGCMNAKDKRSLQTACR